MRLALLLIAMRHRMCVSLKEFHDSHENCLMPSTIHNVRPGGTELRNPFLRSGTAGLSKLC